MMLDMRFAQSSHESVPSPVDISGKFCLKDVDLQDVRCSGFEALKIQVAFFFFFFQVGES